MAQTITTPYTSKRAEHVMEEERSARPDLKAPPSSPEPNERAMEKGLETLERVKPY